MAVAVPHASLASQFAEDSNQSLEMATSSLTASPDSKDEVPMPMPGDFDIVQHYADLLQRDEVRSPGQYLPQITLILTTFNCSAPRYASRCYRVTSTSCSTIRGYV